jgi:CHAT domain-containing protein/Tfp pilus assembly protein PilF
MRIALIAAALALAQGVSAQQPSTDRIRTLAMRNDETALLDAVRDYPDDAREVVRLLLIEAGRRRVIHADSVLALARRVGRVYASAWEDSFPLAQVTRFARLEARERMAKLESDSVRRAGNAAQGQSGIDAALRLWREAMRRATAINDTAGIAAALGNIGAGMYRLAELDSAETLLERARELAESVGDRRTALNAVNTLGSVAKDRGDLHRARVMYSRALDLRSRIGDMRGTAADHNNLGLLSAELGETEDARGHYEEALGIARRHAHDEAAAAALLNLGNAASTEGEYAEAARRYMEALAVYRAAGDDVDAALVLHNLGLLALRRGDYASAKARLTEALAIFGRAGTPADVVLVRRDLASVAAAAGDLSGASAQLQRAERLVRAESDPELVAGVALARADLAMLLNSYPEAERQYARAEVLYRRAGMRAERAEAQHGLGMLLSERRQYARALVVLRAAAQAQAASGDRRPAALTQLMIGHVQHRQGDVAGARRTLEQATDSLRALGDVVGEAAALSALADLELDEGRPLAAERLYRRGLSRLTRRPAAPVSWQLRAGLGRALHHRGALGDAAVELRASVEDIERVAGTLRLEERRAAFLADKWDVYAQLAMVERARGDAAAAFAASERMRARQMLDLLARGRVTRPMSLDSGLVEREQDLRRRIIELTQRVEVEESTVGTRRGRTLADDPGSEPGTTRHVLARAHEQYEELLLALREDARSYARIVRGEVSGWREVAGRLRPGEVMLEYLVADSGTVVFVLTRDTLRVVDLDAGRRAIESLVDFARGTLARPKAATSAARAAWRTPLRRLHEYLIAPLENAGALKGVQRLIIIPHAELHYLPFAALLRSGPRDAFLIEQYDIAYAPSASVWLRLGERPTPRGSDVLALAPRSAALPGSGEEVEMIRSLFGRQATVLRDGAASEAAFRVEAPQHGVVHLATYGVLNKHNPMFSYVALSPGADVDGRLEVHEVFGLELRARLVVLSACQTALASGLVTDVPAGDDWVGLVRAFLGIGASNVIATLWPVEDRATARVMEMLYRRLRAGETEGSALSAAQREALRQPATADPFYWAGFVLVGGR